MGEIILLDLFKKKTKTEVADSDETKFSPAAQKLRQEEERHKNNEKVIRRYGLY